MFAYGANTFDDEFNYSIQQVAKELIGHLQTHMIEVYKWGVYYEVFGSVLENPKLKSKAMEMGSKRLKNMLSDIGLDMVQQDEYFQYKPNDKSIVKSKNYLNQYFNSDNEWQNKLDLHGKMLMYFEKNKLSDRDFIQLANEVVSLRETIFEKEYGQKKEYPWRKIVACLEGLINAKDMREKIYWIDTAYHTEHVSGSVFNKTSSYSSTGKPSSVFPQTGKEFPEYEWIRKSLDWKRNVIDLRAYYEKVSPAIKPIVAYYSKLSSNKTIEDFK